MENIRKLAFADIMETCPVGAERVPPKEFVVLKFGKNHYTVDGEESDFDFDEQDADQIIEEFEKRGKDLLMDIEHASLIPGKPAPAYGWINKLKKGREGVIAEMANWTEEAEDLLRKGKYRYHSPVLYFGEGEKAKHPAAIQSVTLTNHPALHRYSSLVAACDTGVQQKNLIEKQLIKAKIKLGETEDLSIVSELEKKIDVGLQQLSDITSGMTKEYFEYTNMLFLSDISDKAKEMLNTKDVQGLILLKEAKGVTDAEIQYIDALLKYIEEREPISSENLINNKQEAVTMLTDKLKKIKAFADGDLTIDELVDENVDMAAPDENVGDMEEEAPAEDAGAMLDQAKETIKVVVEQLSNLAQALGIDVGTVENEMALFDVVIKKVNGQKEALAKIADAYNCERKDDPVALADMVLVERIAVPPQAEVKKLTEKLALTDQKIQEQEATKAVQAALEAGNIPECNKEKALKFALSDLKAFNDAFAPGNGIQIVPVDKENGTQTEPDKVANAKESVEDKFLALSDRHRKIAKQFGLTAEEAVENYGNK